MVDPQERQLILSPHFALYDRRFFPQQLLKIILISGKEMPMVAFCTVLLSALKFQATLAKQLSNRRVEVFDILKLVELCRAVDNVDTMSVDAALVLLVNSAVLDMIVTTADDEEKHLVFGSDECMQTSL